MDRLKLLLDFIDLSHPSFTLTIYKAHHSGDRGVNVQPEDLLVSRGDAERILRMAEFLKNNQEIISDDPNVAYTKLNHERSKK